MRGWRLWHLALSCTVPHRPPPPSAACPPRAPAEADPPPSPNTRFLVKTEGVTNRNWEGDTPGPLVTYRSIAGQVKYIWPIQTPLTDFDAQRKRLGAVREQLRWQLIGCELIECFQ